MSTAIRLFLLSLKLCPEEYGLCCFSKSQVCKFKKTALPREPSEISSRKLSFLPLTIVCAPSVCWLCPYLSAFLRQSNRILGATDPGATMPGFRFWFALLTLRLWTALVGTVRIKRRLCCGAVSHILRSDVAKPSIQ